MSATGAHASRASRRRRSGVGLERKESAVRNAAAKHSLIVGLGATGAAVARYLTARGERVRVIDSRAAPPGLAELRAAVPGVDVSLETLDERWLDDASRVLLSPGLPYDLPLAVEARRRGLAVIGDIELFALAARAPVIAVTGSNGKSTVTTLASKMLEVATAAGAGRRQPRPARARSARASRSRRVRARDLELPDGDDRQLGAARRDGAQRLGGSPRSPRHARALRRAQREAARRRPSTPSSTPTIRSSRRWARATRASCRSPCRRELARGYSIVARDGERWLARDRKPLLRSAELRHSRHAQRGERARGARADGGAHDRHRRGARRAAHLHGLAAPLPARRGAQGRHVRRRLEGHERRRHARRAERARRPARADRGGLEQRPGSRRRSRPARAASCAPPC